MKEKIRIGNAGGYWGDDLGAFKRQITGGEIDYISADYLAEITMSILKKQQQKNPELGYVSDFIDQMIEIAPCIQEKKVCILSNAGGINPIACGKKLQEELLKRNYQLKILVIDGDDLMNQLDDWHPEQADFKNMENSENFSKIKDSVRSANAYLGIPPLVEALKHNPDIIIAGRVTDTSITMAPMIHEFGWEANDWNKLAAGLVAGHIIECGAQSSGGNFTDWHKIQQWENFGYPIIEMYPDASFIVTKHERTGGFINADVIKEQLLYEMGNPKAYISPDVVADFTSIQLEDAGNNRVKVSGIEGKASTPFLKVSMAYENGYKATGSIIVSGGDALEKAKIFAESFWNRLGIDFEKTDTSFVGYNSCHKGLIQDLEPSEILLRFSAYDKDHSKLKKFGEQIAPLILSGPPGVAVTSGRPRVQQVMSYWPALLPKELVSSRVMIIHPEGEEIIKESISSVLSYEKALQVENPHMQISNEDFKRAGFVHPGGKKVKVKEICLARSGDKGDMANIGLIARNEIVFEFIKEHFTANFIKLIFVSFTNARVIRYQLDNLQALNFLLEESLDGGGTESLLIDAQGKTFASAILNQEIEIPMEIYNSLKS